MDASLLHVVLSVRLSLDMRGIGIGVGVVGGTLQELAVGMDLEAPASSSLVGMDLKAPLGVPLLVI